MKVSCLALAMAFSTAAFAAPITYTTSLSGPNESPATGSPGVGTGMVIIDTTANTLFVSETFSGLTSATTASHIHCCTTAPLSGTAGVATQTPTFSGFPLGVTSGSFSQTFDLTQASTYNPAFVTSSGSVAAAEAALAAGMAAGETYLNIHTTANPGGEIRGFLQTGAAAAPEPGTIGLGALALLGFLGLRKRLQS